jgi:hypothetical protein
MKIVAKSRVVRDLPFTIALEDGWDVRNMGKILRFYMHSSSHHSGTEEVRMRRRMVEEILDAIGEATSAD